MSLCRSPVSAIVLAAGESRRMGPANKLLLDFKGKPVLGHCLDVVRAAKLDEIVVVLGHQASAVRPIVTCRGLPWVFNADFQAGLTRSIQAGVAAAKPGNALLICLSDQVALSCSDLNLLIDAFRQCDPLRPVIVIPTFNGKRGNPVLFDNAFRDEILALDLLDGCKPIVRLHHAKVLEIALASDAPLRDMDYPEDYLAFLDEG